MNGTWIRLTREELYKKVWLILRESAILLSIGLGIGLPWQSQLRMLDERYCLGCAPVTRRPWQQR